MPVITFDTSTTSDGELTAIIALCASLGGRLPHDAVTPLAAHAPNRGERPETVATPQAAAESLMALAAATRTTPAPAAGEDDQTFDPASLDASGVPWDERIHSSNQKRTADDMWRKRRGVDDVTFGMVHGELSEAAALRGERTGTDRSGLDSSSTTSAPTDVAPPPPTSPDQAAPPPPPADAEGKAPPPPTVVESVPTAGITAPAPVASGVFEDFPSFVQAVNALTKKDGKGLIYDDLNGLAAMVGATKFLEMKDRPEAWGDFYKLASEQ